MTLYAIQFFASLKFLIQFTHRQKETKFLKYKANKKILKFVQKLQIKKKNSSPNHLCDIILPKKVIKE